MAYPGIGAFSTFGYQNVYIPGYMGDGESQKRLIIGFTLNEDDFTLNNIATVFGADKPKGFYLRYYSPDFVRIPHATGIDLRWADGAERPRAQENPRFTNQSFEMFRYGDQTYIGDMSEDFSEIGSFIPTVQKTFAGQFMIRRLIAANTELTTSGNYPSAGTVHYYATWNALAAAAASLGYAANYFGVAGVDTILSGSINDPLIGKFIKHAVLTILKRTNGQIKPQDLLLYMNPNTANRLANTQEIRAYMAQQVDSIKVLKGDEPSLWPTFGLPNPLYGLKVVVDPTVKVTAKQDRANEDTQSFVIDDGLISVIARPGSVVGMPGSQPGGSLTLWQHKKSAMKPETFPDPQNRRVQIAFSDMYTVQLTCPEATFTMANAFSA